MFEQAARDGRLVSNPARYIELPSVTRIEMSFLTIDQVDEIADAIDPRYRVMVKMAALTGLRFGELAGLQTKDLDMLRAKVRVVRTVNEVRGQIIVGEPKTAAGRRPVSLPRSLVEEIAAHLQLTPRTIGEESWVFPAPQGGPIRRNHFRRRIWEPATRAAAFEGLRP